jgi:hypothetical protein
MIDWTKETSGGKNYCGYCTGTPADGTAKCNGDCFKETSPNFKENREDQIKRKIHFHKYMLARYEFDKQDWASFHDALFNATYDDKSDEGKNFTQDELEVLFMTLSDDLQYKAFLWGMSDTEWRENVYKWYQENMMK